MADMEITDDAISAEAGNLKENVAGDSQLITDNVNKSDESLKDTQAKNKNLGDKEEGKGDSSDTKNEDQKEESKSVEEIEVDIDKNEENANGDDENDNKSEETTDPYEYTKRGQFTSEIFKIELRNLPRFGFGQMKKLLSGLKLDPVKIKSFGLKDCAFVTFRCEEDRKKALTTLNGYKWRNRKIKAVKAKPMRDPLVMKRKRDAEEESGEKKKTKSSENDDGLPPDIRLKNASEPLWNVPYEKQLEEKKTNMSLFLMRLAKEIKKKAPEALDEWLDQSLKDNNDQACELVEILPSPILEGYRNKCELTIGKDLEGVDNTVGFRFGAYREGTNAIGDPNHLSIVPQSIKTVAKEFQKWIRLSRYSAFDPETKKGHWSQLTVRICREGDIMAIADFHPQSLKQSEIHAEMQRIKDYFSAGVTSFWFRQIGERQPDSLLDPNLTHLFGSKTLTEDLLGMKFDISPDAFFQVNTAAAEVLYRVIADWCEVTPNTTLLDICCGTGTIGLSMAKDVFEVIGLERCPVAVADAKRNARMNGINNAVFILGSAEKFMPRVPKMMRTNECVAVLDPPRGGVHPRVMRVIRKTEQIKKLIYVSCSPRGAIPNIIELVRRRSKKVKGAPFKPVRACPIDLFPMTGHVELVIEFRRLDSSIHREHDSAQSSNESDDECDDDSMSEKDEDDKDEKKQEPNNENDENESGNKKSKSPKKSDKSGSNSTDGKRRRDRKSGSNQLRDGHSQKPSDHDRFFHLAGYGDSMFDTPPGFPDEGDLFAFGGSPGMRFQDFRPDFDRPPRFGGSPGFDGPPMFGGSPGFGGPSRFGRRNEFFDRGFDYPPRFGFSEDFYDRDGFMGPPAFGFSEDYERFDDFEPLSGFRRPFGPRDNVQRDRGFREQQFAHRGDHFDRGGQSDSFRGRGNRMRGFGHTDSFRNRDHISVGHGPEDSFGRGQNVFSDPSTGKEKGGLLNQPDTVKSRGNSFRGAILGNPRGRGLGKSDSVRGIGKLSDQKSTKPDDGKKEDKSRGEDVGGKKLLSSIDGTDGKSKKFDGASSRSQSSVGKTENWVSSGSSSASNTIRQPKGQYGFSDSNRSQSGQTGNQFGWKSGTGQSFKTGNQYSGGGTGKSFGQAGNQYSGGGTGQSSGQTGNQYGGGGTGQSYGQTGNQYSSGGTGKTFGQTDNQYSSGGTGQSYGQTGNQYSSAGTVQSYGQTDNQYSSGGTGQSYGQTSNQYSSVGTGQSYGQTSNQYSSGGTVQSYGQTGNQYSSGGTVQSYGQTGNQYSSGGTGQSYGQTSNQYSSGGTGQSYGQTSNQYSSGETGQSYGQTSNQFSSGETGKSYGQTDNQYSGGGTGQSYGQTDNQYGGGGATGQSYGQTDNQYGGGATGQSYGQTGNQYGTETSTQYNWAANPGSGSNSWQTYNQSDQNGTQGNWNTSDQSSYNQAANQNTWNMSNQNAYSQIGSQYSGTSNTAYNQYSSGTSTPQASNLYGSGTTTAQNNQYTGVGSTLQTGYNQYSAGSSAGSDQTASQSNWAVAGAGAGGQPYYQTSTTGQWGNQYGASSSYGQPNTYDPTASQYTAESYSTSSGLGQKSS